MNNQLVPFEQQLALAESIAKSGMFGIKTRDQAIVLMALCESENIHPIKACADYHIINGRPALKADAMLVRFHAAGGKVEWKQYTDEVVTAVFSHPQGGTIEITWTFEQAKKIGLTSKDTWKAYPRAMLRARVISEGVRTVWPGANAGMYTVEEVQDFAEVPEKAPKVVAQQFIAQNPLQIPSRIGLDSVYASTLDDGIAQLDIDKPRLLAWAQKKYKVANFSDLTFDQCSDLISRLPKFAETAQKATTESPDPHISEYDAEQLLLMAAETREAAEHSDDPATRRADLARAKSYEKRAADLRATG
jgi:hypothetical protein